MKIFIPSRNLILATTIFLVYIVPLRAQIRPEEYLDGHNKARAAVGVSPLTFDYPLASQAASFAFTRAPVIGACSPLGSEGVSGLNVAIGNSTMTGVEAVEMWVNQKSDYDYNSNTCAPTKSCSRYTQVVWRNSTKFGCARVRCIGGERFVLCLYSPPGNVNGERPY